MAITKKIRFEIFKRDNFQCKYCGKTPPEVTLEVDHIIPKAEKGTDNINNLITSCFNCNRGKGKILLDKLPSTITENLKVIKEQQKQTKAYYKFIEDMESKKESDLQDIGFHFFNLFQKTKRTHNKYVFSNKCKISIKLFLKIFTKYEIIEAVDIAYNRFSCDNDEVKVFRYMCGILHNWRRERNGEN